MNLGNFVSLGSGFFRWVLQTSWQAAVLAGLILAGQWLLRKRLSPAWRYGLWLLLVVRLLMPSSPPSAFSIFNLAHRGAKPLVATNSTTVLTESVAREPGKEASRGEALLSTPPGNPVVVPAPVVDKPGATVDWFAVALCVYLAGACFFATRLVWSNGRFRSRIGGYHAIAADEVTQLFNDCRAALQISQPVHLIESEEVASPAVYGFWRKWLLLPDGVFERFSAAELRCIFLHELAHIKRRDLGVNWLVSILQVLHWFNPVLWVAWARMRADRELATDALALAHIRASDHVPYGETILKVLEGLSTDRAWPGLVGIAESKAQLKERLAAIGRASKYWKLPALGLAATLALIGLTGAQNARPQSQPSGTGKTLASKIAGMAPSSPTLTVSHPLKAYFLQGRGELSMTDSGQLGYEKFASVLRENEIEVNNLWLRSLGVPTDCNLLIIAAPSEAFDSAELQQIDKYLHEGGRLLALFSYAPQAPPTGLETVLRTWGVEVNDDVVQDFKYATTSIGYDIKVYQFAKHPVMDALAQSQLHLYLPHPILKMPARQSANAPQVDELFATSPGGTLLNSRNGPTNRYSLACAVEQKPVAGVKTPRGNTRIIVVGDATFLGNLMIDSGGNRDFLEAAINWLVDRGPQAAGGGSPFDGMVRIQVQGTDKLETAASSKNSTKAGISGRVVDARGHPVNNVQMAIYRLTPRAWWDGRPQRASSGLELTRLPTPRIFNPDYGHPMADLPLAKESWSFCTTDVQGQFYLNDFDRALGLVAVSEKGIGWTATNAFSTNMTVTLKPWGRIEGTLWHYNEVVANEPVQFFFAYQDGIPSWGPGFGLDTKTDDHGSFAFDFVPPGYYGFDSAGMGEHVIVKSGQTAVVKLGGSGRPVVGKFRILDPDGKIESAGECSYFFITSMAKFGAKTGDELKALHQQPIWDNTFTNFHIRHVQCAKDGSFHIDQVGPGKYELSAGITAKAATNMWYAGVREVEIPASDPKMREPLDLGLLEISLRLQSLPNQ